MEEQDLFYEGLVLAFGVGRAFSGDTVSGDTVSLTVPFLSPLVELHAVLRYFFSSWLW